MLGRGCSPFPFVASLGDAFPPQGARHATGQLSSFLSGELLQEVRSMGVRAIGWLAGLPFP